MFVKLKHFGRLQILDGYIFGHFLFEKKSSKIFGK